MRYDFLLVPLGLAVGLGLVACNGLRAKNSLLSQGGSSLSPSRAPSPAPSGAPSVAPSSGVSPALSPMISPAVSAMPSPNLSPGPGNVGYFPPGNLWEQDISNAANFPKDADSDAVIANLNSLGGWGTGDLRTDTSIVLNVIGSPAPMAPFVKGPGYYLPDCDDLPQLPLPVGGSIEAHDNYVCPAGTTGGEDCHLLIWDKAARKLFESYATTQLSGGSISSMCLVSWDLTKNYPQGRGNGCTSADAAGFPIAPLLFTADEIAAGEIKHAIRLILPNNRWRRTQFVHPATHSGGFGNTNSNGVLYGSRFRLKASFDISGLSPEGKVLARAMKKYGMFAADGGQIALTGMSDKFSQNKWSQFTPVNDPRFAPIDMRALRVTDFEIVNSGRQIGDAAAGCTPANR